MLTAPLRAPQRRTAVDKVMVCQGLGPRVKGRVRGLVGPCSSRGSVIVTLHVRLHARVDMIFPLSVCSNACGTSLIATETRSR